MTSGEDCKNNLRRRTKAFASLVVRIYIRLDKRREEIRVLGRQLLRSGTSVAANYRESSRTRTVDEFVANAELCTQEADETQFWLELLRDDGGVPADLIEPIWREADELIAIIVKMAKRAKSRQEREDN